MKPSDGAKSRLSQLRSEAFLASQRQDDLEVIRLLKQILALDESETRTRKQLAALLFSKAKFQDARAILIAGLKQSPADSSMRLMLARIYYKEQSKQQAFEVLVSHPKNAQANDEMLSFRAALAEQVGEYAIAQHDYNVLVTRNPLDAKWWLGLGVAQDKQQLTQQAIGSYQQAQQLKQLPSQVESFLQQRLTLLARRS